MAYSNGTDSAVEIAKTGPAKPQENIWSKKLDEVTVRVSMNAVQETVSE